MHKDKYYMSA